MARLRKRPIKHGLSRLTHYDDPELERLRREVDEEIRRLRVAQSDDDEVECCDGAFLIDGSRAMTGNMDLGGNNISNANISATEISSGTLPAARMPALTGDVTTTAGTVATTIANGAVTLAKMANLATNTMIGRATAGTGVPEAITVTAAGRALIDDADAAAQRTTLALAAIAASGSAADLSAGIIPDARMPDLTGDVTTTEGAVATTIANDVVSDAKLRNSGARSVIGRSANSSGDPADISGGGSSSNIQVLSDDGSTVDWRAMSSLDSGLPQWVSVRAIDFSSWASTDFSGDADGTTHSLDGGDGAITWTSQGMANANAGSSTTGGFFRRNSSDTGDDSRAGLRMFHDASASTNWNTTTHTGPRITIPITSLIPNYSPMETYRIEIEVNRFTDSSSGTPPTALGFYFGLFQAAGTPTGSAARLSAVALQRNGASNGAPTISSAAGTRLPITASTHTYQGSHAHNVLGLRIGPDGVVVAYGGDYGSTWPADTALRVVGQTSGVTINGAVSAINDENNLFELGIASLSSSTGSVDIMVTRLRVLKKVR